MEGPMSVQGVQVWERQVQEAANDLMFDACANERQIECVTIIDEYTRESTTIDVADSIGSARVTEAKTRLMSLQATLAYLWSRSRSR
jgi:putative transposase